MADIDFIRPGLIHGIYPEKKIREIAGLEKILTNLVKPIKRKSRLRHTRYQSIVEKVNNDADHMASLNDHDMAEIIRLLRNKLQRQGFTEELVAKAFALIKELAHRTLGMRHFDVQLIGGWVMLNGLIAEMETGEGKSLTATLPACTAALAGVPVHIVTVNDYLVKRDAEQMKPLYRALGLTVGAITQDMEQSDRKIAYGCDIAYCSNKQLAFDYLRDRLVFGKQVSKTQLQIESFDNRNSKIDRLLLRGLCYAIVDEADSVLIDESRTPLIISREGNDCGLREIAYQAIEISKQLQENDDYKIDIKNRLIEISEAGKNHIRELVEPYGGLWKGYQRSLELVSQALSARFLFTRDKHYLVKDKKIQIIDEYTGRLMADRSWEYGLHQMLEAKEDCVITSQKETLAKISYQQFFRRYLKLAGMTGTGREVSSELGAVYQLDVVPIPTNKPVRRRQHRTRIFKTAEQKWQGIVNRIIEIHESGRPILIGTRSVEASENLSAMLTRTGLKHQVLNARQDASEAEIIKQAGQYMQITVATNMAGRGTDIKLPAEMVGIGGLHVIATECHEARRIDRQLFGRCGRQGDNGSFELIVSLEDELVKNYCPKLIRAFFCLFDL